MKKRFLYSLLFGIPGCLIALPVSLFVFVDFIDFVDTHDIVWVKSMSDGALFSILILLFLGLLILSIVFGYRTGRKFEAEPELNRKHIRIAGMLSLLIFTAVFLGVYRFVKSEADSDRCGDICYRSGFHGAVGPAMDEKEKYCRCFNLSDDLAIEFPLGNLDPDTLDMESIK